MTEESAAHARKMRGTCLPIAAPAGVGELRVEAAPVSFTTNSSDRAVADETVDEARQPALAEHHGCRELGHSHPPAWGVGKRQQDLVLVEGEVVPGVELGVEVTDEGCVSPQ